MDRNKLYAIALMLMAVLGALVLLFILGGGLMRALFRWAAGTDGIVIVTRGQSVSLVLVLVLAAVVIAVAVVLYRRIGRYPPRSD